MRRGRGRGRGRGNPPLRSTSLRRAMHMASSASLAQRVTRQMHPRSVFPHDVSALMDRIHNLNAYIRPNRRLLQGLAALNVFRGTMFDSNAYLNEIMNRPAPFANPLSDEAISHMLWSEIHNAPRGGRQATFDISDNSLRIPLHDVYELPSSVFHYVLEMMQRETTPGETYTVYFAFEPENMIANVQHRIGMLSTTRTGLIRINYITEIFNRIMGEIFTVFNGFDPNDGVKTWTGSEDSDTRIRLLNRGQLYWRLKLFFHRSHSVRGGGCWTEEMAEYVRTKFPERSFYTVKNTDDEECFLYMVDLGMMIANTEYWMINEDRILEPSTIRCHGLYNSNNGSIERISRMILEREEDDFQGLKQLQANDQISVREFQRIMFNLEQEIFTDESDEVMNKTGIDVYVLDEGISKHVYPVYMSKRCVGDGGKHIRLLSVTNKGKSHFLYITNMADIMAKSAGKIFYNCSVCNQAFFTRTGLYKHACDARINAEKYQWSRFDIPVNDESNIIGTCDKCMLKFKTEFEYVYHKEHCLMEGRSGYRHVHCIHESDCDNADRVPVLEGQAITEEELKMHARSSYIMYADFESCINPETGEHTFMSYGIFDTISGEFKIDYSMDSFMEYIYEIAKRVPKICIYFHNAMGYDANFILRYALTSEMCKDWSVKTMMKSSNRLQKLCFQFHYEGDDDDASVDFNPETGEPVQQRKRGRKKSNRHIIEIGDTFMFLTMSLDGIVKCIRKPTVEENYAIFPKFFDEMYKAYEGISDESLMQVLKKNIFPYKFFTSPERLDIEKNEFLKIFDGSNEENLQFFSETVTKEQLDQQYPVVQRVFEDFNIRTARDYHDLYLRCDVMQLADAFSSTITALMDTHKVFLPDYIGMPAASWAAFLRYDPALNIPLYTNTIYAEFFQDMTRGGVTSAPLRYAKSDETHSIIYLDVNGLYPYVMQRYKYPSGYFLWVNFDIGPERDCNEFLMREIFPDLEAKGEGMCIAVDLHYTDEVKKATDDYPFAPEHRLIYDQYFGDDQTFLVNWSVANNNEQMKPFRGLVGTLYDKKQYGVHWKLLKWYIEHGLIVTRIYWGIRFEESQYLAGYIQGNIELRNQCCAKNDDIGALLYKLMSNSIYGKTFESPFKRGSYEIVCDQAKLQGMIEEGNISTITPIDELGWVIKMDGDEIVLDKPTYIGACVVEYAKLHMYELLYDKLKVIFKDVKLVYTDTDSFIVLIEHPPEFQDSKKLFAFIREKCPDLLGKLGGQVKSETGEDDTIDEIIALRSKVYAYKTKKGYFGKRAKGTTKAAQEMQLDWEEYKKVLSELRSKDTVNMQFMRNRFNIQTLQVAKQSLSANDGKRNICPDGIHTHAWGYDS